jgi:uncharacterized BrkB/YihY/UPF0761 family membrane protein
MIVTTLWIIGMAVVGAVAIVSVVTLCFAVANVVVKLWERVPKASFATQRRLDAVMEVFAAILFFGLLLFIATMIGLLIFQGSYDHFGWPPIPNWAKNG